MRPMGSWFREVALGELRAQVSLLAFLLQCFYIITYCYTTGSFPPWCVTFLWMIWPPCFLLFFQLPFSNRLHLSFHLDFIFPIGYHTLLSVFKKNYQSIISLPHCFIPSSHFHRVSTKHINHFEGDQYYAWHSMQPFSGSFILPLLPKSRLVCLFSADQKLANYGLWTKSGPPAFYKLSFIGTQSCSHVYSLSINMHDQGEGLHRDCIIRRNVCGSLLQTKGFFFVCVFPLSYLLS